MSAGKGGGAAVSFFLFRAPNCHKDDRYRPFPLARHECHKSYKDNQSVCAEERCKILVFISKLTSDCFGPPARNGRKRAQERILAPPDIFRPFFPSGAKIHFSAIFFPFRASGPKWGLYRAITTDVTITKETSNYKKICGGGVLYQFR